MNFMTPNKPRCFVKLLGTVIIFISGCFKADCLAAGSGVTIIAGGTTALATVNSIETQAQVSLANSKFELISFGEPCYLPKQGADSTSGVVRLSHALNNRGALIVDRYKPDSLGNYVLSVWENGQFTDVRHWFETDKDYWMGEWVVRLKDDNNIVVVKYPLVYGDYPYAHVLEGESESITLYHYENGVVTDQGTSTIGGGTALWGYQSGSIYYPVVAISGNGNLLYQWQSADPAASDQRMNLSIWDTHAFYQLTCPYTHKLDDYLQSTYGVVYALNDFNEVSSITNLAGGVIRPFFRDRTGTVFMLPTKYPDGTDATQVDIRGINNAGQTIGTIGITPVMWDKTALKYLEVPAGSTQGEPLGVNKYGQAVGWVDGHFVNNQYEPDIPGLWENARFIDLRQRVVNLGTVLLTAALEINDRGEILCEASTSQLYLLKPLRTELAVDANHDSSIRLSVEDESDRTAADKPYHFWINSDHDNGSTASDAVNGKVDGLNDLKDFFPVFVDLRQILTAYAGSSGLKCTLKNAAGAVNVVFSSLERASANAFKQGILNIGFGPTLMQSSDSADSVQVTAEGIELPAAFLNRIRSGSGGIILVEGRQPTKEPLVLTVEKDGILLLNSSLYLDLYSINTQIVSRDNPESTWVTPAISTISPSAIFAGTGAGDLVSWSLLDPSPSGTTFTWSARRAQDSIDKTIFGPTGSAAKEWNFSDGSFDWAPGNYRIQCIVATPGVSPYVINFEQEVGWRTAQYMVVGIVRPITDISLDENKQAALKQDLIQDLVASGIPAPINQSLQIAPVLNVAEAWLLLNAFPVKRTANLPNSDYSSRIWIIQETLSANPDNVLLPLDIDSDTTHELFLNRPYRMLSLVQLKYTLDNAGKLVKVQTVGTKISDNGPTKIDPPVPGFVEEAINTGLNLPIPFVNGQYWWDSEPSPFSGQINIDAARRKISLYTSARVGPEGQFPNYALLGRDVPYIFNEIVFGIDADGKDSDNYVRMSVDRVWRADGTITGSSHFNQVYVYKRLMGQPNSRYRRLQFFPIEGGAGMLKPFLESVPLGQFPTEVLLPEVNGPL